jgi:hypothetical protein
VIDEVPVSVIARRIGRRIDVESYRLSLLPWYALIARARINGRIEALQYELNSLLAPARSTTVWDCDRS